MFRCAICQETLDVVKIAAVKCGHTFHLACLTEWLQRSKSCPSCRYPVKNLSQDLIEHLYLEFSSLNSFLSTPNTSLSSEDLETRYIALQSNIASLNDQISSLQVQNQDKCREIDALKLCICKLEADKKTLQNNSDAQACKIALLKDRAADCSHLEQENKKLLLRNKNLEKKMSTLESLNKILDGSNDEAQKIVDNLSYADFKETKILLNALKQQLQSSNTKLSKSNEENRKLKNQSKDAADENKKLSNLVQELREEVKLLRTRPNQTPFNRNLKEILKDTPIDDSNSKLENDDDAGFSCSTPKISVNNRKAEALKLGQNAKIAPKNTKTIAPPFQIPFDELDSSIPPFDVPLLGGLKTRQKTSKANDENIYKAIKKPAVKALTKRPDGLGGRAAPISTRSKRPTGVAVASKIVAKKPKNLVDDSCILLSD